MEIFGLRYFFFKGEERDGVGVMLRKILFRVV